MLNTAVFSNTVFKVACALFSLLWHAKFFLSNVKEDCRLVAFSLKDAVKC